MQIVLVPLNIERKNLTVNTDNFNMLYLSALNTHPKLHEIISVRYCFCFLIMTDYLGTIIRKLLTGVK